MRRLAVAVLAACTAACAPHPRAAQAPAAPRQTVWDRQINNAKDAGDGDYQLRQLRAQAAASPESIPARLSLAKAYRERGYPDVALEMCRLAAARFPESGEAQLALAGALRDMNLRNEAIGGLVAFLEAHPQRGPEYFSWLGILRDESGAWAAAEEAHRIALRLAPSFDYLHNNLGFNLLMQKKYEEAAAEFREALKLNPGSQMARNNLGQALANLNAAGEAVSAWQSATDSATAHNNLAAVLIEQGKYSEARKELQTALSYNKSHPAALRNMDLVSRLDGNPVALPTQSVETTHWERFKTGFIRLFVGPLDDSRTAPAKTGSAPETGEER